MVVKFRQQKSKAKGSVTSFKHELTESQLRVFQFIKDQFFAAGSMPTLREICAAMKWSAVGSAQTVIEALISKGYLERDSQKARGLRLTQEIDFRPAPILGSAPAGHAVESIENHDGDVLVPSFLRGPIFAVRVRGDSMINAGIENDDLVIVRQATTAQPDEIVVAMVDGEVTIKKFIRKKDEVWLYPENSKYQPRKIEDNSSFRILGTVVGLHRYWDN